MNLLQCIEKIKHHPDFDKVGMVLSHNGVVRRTSRDGRKVIGLIVSVDHHRLNEVVEAQKKTPGIIDVIVEIDENKLLKVGDDIMLIVVAGDIRDNVLTVMEKTLNEIKQTVTQKTEYFIDKQLPQNKQSGAENV